MEFSDITKAIHDAWSFSWPPLFMCLILYIIAKHQHADNTTRLIQYTLNSLKEYGRQINSFKDVLEPYGLKKIVPITFAFIVIVFLYILNTPITVLASKVPPQFSFSPDILMERSMSDEEKLVVLRKFPTAQHFNAAYFMALSSYKSKHTSKKMNFSEFNFKINNFVKFSFLSSLFIAILNIKYGSSILRQFGKSLIVFAILVPVWSINFLQLLGNQEIQIHNEWSQVRVELLKDSNSLLLKEKTERERDILNRLSSENNRRWWNLKFYDPNYINWLEYTFFPK